MADFLLNDLRGGLNTSDPPTALSVDQCTQADNVEWVNGRLGDRRLGGLEIDLVGSPVENCDRVVWVFRHTPTVDLSDAQLWVLGITDPSTAILCYKDTTWHTVTVSDAFTVDGVSEYQVEGQSLHGKLFIAYNSAVDRLHVWDGTSFRRTGLAEPAAPSCADSAPAGSYIGVRYARVRYVVVSGSTVLRRSEPSDVTTFTPAGTKTGMVVTKPASISEGETHWEIELSTNNADFYRVTRQVVGTTTYTDTVDYVSGYATSTGAVLSETVGDYDLIWSVKHLLADANRLVFAGGFEDVDLSSRTGWTPVLNDPGDGNDERIPLSTDNYKDLDTHEGGPIIDMSRVADGYFYVFKVGAVYKFVRSGQRTRAYDDFRIVGAHGALSGSVMDGLDQLGNPAIYFIDPDVGPSMIGSRGLELCGWDLRTTWASINQDATKVVCRSLWFKPKRQAHWWIATGANNTPNVHAVLSTQNMVDGPDGKHKGWALWPGDSEAVLAVCVFSDNIDDDTARSKFLVPFLALEGDGLIWQMEQGDNDNGTEYTCTITSRPFLHNNLLRQFESDNGVLFGKAQVGGKVKVSIIGDLGRDSTLRKDITGITLDPESTEDYVIKVLDNLGCAEMRAMQVSFSDSYGVDPAVHWELSMLTLEETKVR